MENYNLIMKNYIYIRDNSIKFKFKMKKFIL